MLKLSANRSKADKYHFSGLKMARYLCCTNVEQIDKKNR
jgi:hypothetical protein